MNRLEAALKEAGIREVRRANEALVVGRLDIRGVGPVRAVARSEGEGFVAQLHHTPLRMGAASRRAVAQYLGVLAEQVRDPGFSAGVSEGEGIIWMSASGRLEEVAGKAFLLAGLARPALQALDALCRDEALARLYVEMQTEGAGGRRPAPEKEDGR